MTFITGSQQDLSNGELFGRRCSLIVANDADGLELSELRVQFQISAADIETPNTLVARIYNPDDQTIKKVRSEFTRVVLQAGYVSQFGVIFDGTLKQARDGRLNSTDTYLDLVGADGDLLYNFGFVNKTIDSSMNLRDQITTIIKEMGGEVGYLPDSLGGTTPNPRGKTFYGLGRDYLRDWAESRGMTWSIQGGKVSLIPLTSYLPGEAIVLNSQTGLIGLPEQTQEGIKARCLLNPKIVVGAKVQIDNASIQKAQRTVTNKDFTLTNDEWTAFKRFATISRDGFYRVLVAEHTGDTRGNDWYTDITCLSVDQSAPPSQSVKAYP